MNQLERRLTRGLDEITDRAVPSPSALAEFRARAADYRPEDEQEVLIMLTPATNKPQRQRWVLPALAGAAAVAVIAVIGIVVVRDSNDEVITQTPATEAPIEDTDDAETPVPADTAAQPLDAEVEALAALPWASPDDRYDDPADAAAAFVAFINDIYPEDPTPSDDEFKPYEHVGIDEFVSSDEQSGEVRIRYLKPDGVPTGPIAAAAQITIRQAGPDGSWWVSGAAAPHSVSSGGAGTLTILKPRPGDVVEPPMMASGRNADPSDAVVMFLFADGDPDPLTAVTLTLPGNMAWGDFAMQIGPDNPDCEPIEGFTCDWSGPAGAPGTAIFMTNRGLSTVPVTFAE